MSETFHHLPHHPHQKKKKVRNAHLKVTKVKKDDVGSEQGKGRSVANEHSNNISDQNADF